MANASVSPADAQVKTMDGPAGLHEVIRQRAEDIYARSGGTPGHDLENWAQAEKEILQEIKSRRRTAIVIDVDGVQYVGEYIPDFCEGYAPGEFASGDGVAVRFEGEKMFVQRPNGSELETTVITRIG